VAAGTCPICHKTYKALGPHTRHAHGKTLHDLGLAKRPGRAANRVEPAAVLTEVNGSGEFSELRQFKVLQDKRGNVWLAERIR
jgi:hypothetical protein